MTANTAKPAWTPPKYTVYSFRDELTMALGFTLFSSRVRTLEEAKSFPAPLKVYDDAGVLVFETPAA